MIYHYFHKIKSLISSADSRLVYLGKVIMASCILAMGAQISITLPISTVPLTFQSEALILMSFIWGGRVAAGAVIAYFLQGIMGLPVFASGAFGIGSFFLPSGGYLLGFLPAAWVMGSCADRGWTSNVFLAAGAVILGKIMIFSCGLLWLSLFVPLGQLLAMGLYPFMIDNVVQIATAGALTPVIFRKKINKK